MTSPTIIIVGAGPAGARAAETVVQAGIRPIIIDEAAAPGGQIYRQPPEGRGRDYASLYGFEAAKAHAIHAVFENHAARIDYRPQTQVLDICGNSVTLLHNGTLQVLGFDKVILATGATDRAFPFTGWTLPGVFTLGAAQVALKAQGIAIGKRTALVGAGPLLPLVAYQYLKAGATLSTVLDLTPLRTKFENGPSLLRDWKTTAKGLFYLGSLLHKRVPMAFGVRKVEAMGERAVTGITWVASNGRRQEIECDAIGASIGLRSESQLAELAGCRMDYDNGSRQFVPIVDADGRTSQPHVYICGDGSNIGGADIAELTGERAALLLLSDLGQAIADDRLAKIQRELESRFRFRKALDRAYPFPTQVFNDLPDEITVCRCEHVSLADLKRTAKELGESDINRIKARCRVGMGRCQGRMCSLSASMLLANMLLTDVAEVGLTRSQAPVRLLPLEATASHGGDVDRSI